MFKLADGREVEIDHAIEGVRYNLYNCPGEGRGTHLEAGRVIPPTASSRWTSTMA